MNNIADHIDFVKSQIEYQDRRATATRSNPKKLNFHCESAEHFRSLLTFLEKTWIDRDKNLPSHDVDPAGILFQKELAGLPKEVIEQLSIKNKDPQEILITELIDAAGGKLSLDRILIGIYYKTKEIVKRPLLTAKLYRMVQNEQIYKEPNKRSVYTTTPISQTDSTENDDEDSNQSQEEGEL